MFEHSIKVPQLYKLAAKFAKNVEENNVSLKSVVYEKKHLNIKAAYALVVNSFKYAKQLEFFLKKSRILEKEPRLDPWLAKVLITELVWGKKRLSGESKPVKTVLAYQQIFNAHSSDITEPSEEVKIASIPRYVRVNTLLISVNEAVERFRNEGWIFVRFMDTKNYSGFLEKVANLRPDEFMVDIHVKELLIFPPSTQFYNHTAYEDGLILLQDKASCLPIHLLDPKPETTVLDMCAAPGMKTSQIACKLENKGKVYAVDLNLERLKTVDKLMEMCGITCVTTINKDILNVKDRECPNVEYVLVDPSCSGSGMVNRLDLTKRRKDDEGRIEKLFGFQVMILKHAFRHFPKVKRVVYSTCSLNTKENEGVVQEVIRNCSGFKLIDVKKLIPNWNNFGSEEFGEIGKRCLYSRPEQDYTNGFFVAIFEKLEDGEVNEFLITNETKQNATAINKVVGKNKKEKAFQDSKIDCNMNNKREQEFNEIYNQEMQEHISQENKKRSLKSESNQIVSTQILHKEPCTHIEKKRKKKKKGDAVEEQKYEDSENIKTLEEQSEIIECKERENIVNPKKHKKKKFSDKLENLHQSKSSEVQNEEENCDVPKSMKKKKKKHESYLGEEIDSTPKTTMKEKHSTHSLKKIKKHSTENDLNCVDMLNRENSEEKQSVFESSSNLQIIKKKKRQKLLNKDTSSYFLNNQDVSSEIQEDSNIQLSTRKRKCSLSLIEETHNGSQSVKKTKHLSEGNEEGEKPVTDNSKKQFHVYENNSSSEVKEKKKRGKSTEIGEKEDNLHQSRYKERKDKKKKSDIFGIGNDSSEPALEKKKRQQQLNEENSLVRESLSDFLQTLSSPV